MSENTTATWKIPYPSAAGKVNVTAVDIQEIAERFEAIVAMRAASGFEPGDIKPSAAATPQNGWLLCDGRAVFRAAQPVLFSAIGISCGPGDGIETFNLPNGQQAAFIGQWGVHALGEVGGTPVVTLTGPQTGSPAHTHAASEDGQEVIKEGATEINQSGPLLGIMGTTVEPATGGPIKAATAGIFGKPGEPEQVAPLEAGEGHENMPPWIAVNYFIKT